MPTRIQMSPSPDYPFLLPEQDHYYSPSSSDSASSQCAELPHLPEQSSLQEPRPYFTQSTSRRLRIVHPYARLLAKKDDTKRRRIWNHALEKFIFNPYELSTLGAPHRRTIYLASLEAHIDKLHAQLLEVNRCPVSVAELEPFRGLNSKTAKSMVSSLQHEVSVARLKLLELERANAELECLLQKSETTAEHLCRLSEDILFDVLTSLGIHDDIPSCRQLIDSE